VEANYKRPSIRGSRKVGKIVRFMPRNDLALKIVEAGDRQPGSAIAPSQDLIDFLCEHNLLSTIR